MRRGFNGRVVKSDTDIAEQLSNQPPSISNIDHLEKRFLSISIPVGTQVCPMLSAKLVDTCSPMLSSDSFVRSQKFHVSINKRPMLEFDVMPVQKVKTQNLQTTMIKKSVQINPIASKKKNNRRF